MPARPFGRSLADFGKLGDAEQKLLESCRRGELCVIADDRPDAQTTGDELRAGFLRFLILGGDAENPVHEHGVRIKGARIIGELDLEGVASTSDVWAASCWFDQIPVLRDAHITGNLLLSGSHLPGLAADRLTCDAGLFFRDNFISAGEVRLLGAVIGGDLDCKDATFNLSSGYAFNADRVNVKGAVFLNGKFTANGEVRLLGAVIGGDLACTDATFNGPMNNGKPIGIALNADDIEVNGRVFLDQKFTANGEVRFLGAIIGGNFGCRGATLNGPLNDGKPVGVALNADGINVRGGIFLDDGFTASGQVRLVSAEIGGDLDCKSATFNGLLYQGNLGGSSLSADRINVRGGVFLNQSFSANGEVRLLGAVIGDNFTCTGATINGPLEGGKPTGNALSADAINVKGSIFLNNKFVARGEVRLLGAVIGGNLGCRGATFIGPTKDGKSAGYALTGDRIVVAGGVFLDDRFTANGEVRLLGATISGNLTCMGATFIAGSEYSLNAEGMSVAGTFFFRGLDAPAGDVNLSHANVRVLVDDEGAWGKNLCLTGFTYERIGGSSPKDAKARLEWLDNQRPEWSGKNCKTDQFSPQAWLNLRKVLREAGYAEDARVVGIAFEKRRRGCGQIKDFASRVFHRIYGIFTGYGYRPVRLFYWSLCIWLACAFLYNYDAYRNKFTPADSSVYEDPSCHAAALAPKGTRPINPVFTPPCDGNYPAFSPLVYSLNVFLPIVQLGQESAWAPATKPYSKVLLLNFIRPFIEPANFLQLVIWLETLFGWVAGLLLVAVVSGLARKQDDS